MATFPTLSVLPSYGVSEKYDSNTVFSNKAIFGYDRGRSRFSRNRKIWTIPYSDITDADKALLDAFYQTVGRHTEFDWYTTLSDSLIGYWKFNERGGLTAADRTANANNGTYSAAGVIAHSEKGPFDHCAKTGSGLRCNCGNTTPLSTLGSGSFSISFWMKADETIYSNGRIFAKYQSGVHSIAVYSIETSTTIRFRIEKDDVFKSVDLSGHNAFDQQWHHVVLVCDRTLNLSMGYVDGIKNASSADISTLSSDLTNTGNVVWGALSTGGTYYFNGKLAEARIYSKALTQQEVNLLYTGELGLDKVSFNAKPQFNRAGWDQWETQLELIQYLNPTTY